MRRLALNALFLFFCLLFLILLVTSGPPIVENGVALVLTPRGEIVDQVSGERLDQAFAQLAGGTAAQTPLRQLVRAVELAGDDKRIKLLVLDLDAMGGAGLTKLQELGAALRAFRAKGKRVIAVADEYTQARYYLAAQADEVLMHPLGMLFLEGYGRFDNYYREALDSLSIDYHVFRVGTYKSAVEPLLRNDMSPEVEDSSRQWLSVLWQAYKDDVAAARGLQAADVETFVQTYAERLDEARGDTAGLALAAGLVDRLVDRDVVRQELIAQVGEAHEGDYRGITHEDYLAAQGELDPLPPLFGPSVAILVASGDILYGEQPPGSIGSAPMIDLIRQAREDDTVKALVLRIDSGGGSTFASELIRRELELTRLAGKPVVVSMGSLAASGAYWIAIAADEIWAQPTTLTGSIGIFSTFPTFQAGLQRLGVHADGVGTTPLSGSFRPDLAMSEDLASILQDSTEFGYRRFLELVGEARSMTYDEVDHVAQGRVWSGLDAHQIGLVDQLGSLEDAVASAASRAGLDDYKLHWMEKELTFGEQLMLDMLEASEDPMGRHVAQPMARWARRQLGAAQNPWLQLQHVTGFSPIDRLSRDLGRMQRMNDPRGLYSMCFCEPE